ncbi:MAG: 3-phosphoshikimate 1-carboxyvinyltransferase [Chloroflexota bacterium]
MRHLGATVEVNRGHANILSGGQMSAPAETLDAGNSGTTMRLLLGILAGQQFRSCLSGDDSLRRRPMDRVVKPLTLMGARVQSQGGCAPLYVAPSSLQGIQYSLPVASAQVKSCLLLAGLFATGMTELIEPIRTRDHTERMFRAVGVDVSSREGHIYIEGGQRPQSFTISVPGDISSAAFFFAGAALSGGEVTVRNVGFNPTRIGFISVLQRMGLEVDVRDQQVEGGEPVADVTVRGSVCHPIHIEAPEVPSLVDELPLIALLATQARGRSVITGAAELRLKESDRIALVANVLGALGANVQEMPDGFVIEGPVSLKGSSVRSYGDHRLAMMLAIAGLITTGDTLVNDAQSSAVSFPNFQDALQKVGGKIDTA